MLFIHSLCGFFALHALAWACSDNRGQIAWRPVLSGMVLTIAGGVLLLKAPGVATVFRALNGVVEAIEQATYAGTSFVFGYLGGGALPFAESAPGASFVLAFRALPIVLVIGALSSLLFYWGILPRIVRAFAAVLERLMGIGGAVGLGAAANVFVGMVEAPLFVRPYLARMSRSELFVTMTCGMATIAGTVMVLYATVLAKVMPDALGHILVASVICTPAAIVVAMLMVPPTGEITVGRDIPPSDARSSIDAITRGTVDAVGLFINIIAMLIVLVALVALANRGLAMLPEFNGSAVTLQRVLGIMMAPVVWLMGIPWSEAPIAGSLMGTKTVLNEFIAYLDLAQLPPGALSERSRLMMVYALCGFANLGSLGIMIGGLTTMVPERRADIIALGSRTLVSGTLATLIAGSVVGMLHL